MQPILIKPGIILFLLLFVNLVGFSQDRIILDSGDTIKCSISKITRKYVYYSQDYNGISTKGKILKNHIREWNYMPAQKEPQPEMLPPDYADNVRNNKTESNNLYSERFRITLNAGPAYLLGTTDKAEESLQSKGVSVEDSKNYYSNLKLGYQGKSSVYIHAFGDYWLGALYHGFYTTSQITTPMQLDDVYIYYGNLGERFFVNFAGASLFSVTRYGRSKKLGVSSSLTVGPSFYRNETELLNEQLLIRGTSLATNITLGFEYFILSQISLSLESSMFSSRLKKLNVNNGEITQEVQLEKENYENLSRLDLSLGFIFYW